MFLKIFLQDSTIKNNIAFGELDIDIDELKIKEVLSCPFRRFNK